MTFLFYHIGKARKRGNEVVAIGRCQFSDQWSVISNQGAFPVVLTYRNHLYVKIA